MLSWSPQGQSWRAGGQAGGQGWAHSPQGDHSTAEVREMQASMAPSERLRPRERESIGQDLAVRYHFQRSSPPLLETGGMEVGRGGSGRTAGLSTPKEILPGHTKNLIYRSMSYLGNL